MRKCRPNDREHVLAHCFVALASFSENAIGPTQKQWARERAENCLWALGIPEHAGYRGTYTARPLDIINDTIDLEATKVISELLE